ITPTPRGLGAPRGAGFGADHPGRVGRPQGAVIKSQLKKGLTRANPDASQFTHQDIAHWCDRFHMAMFDVDTDKAINVATGVAADVDAQWDMYLANSYSLEQLKKLDFSKERMPLEWFNDWLEQLKNA
ncbi:MAG: hypothetical protein AB1451_05980, partial [Nitrospirota bacterium]